MVKEQIKINGKTIEEDLQEGRALIDEAKNYLLLKGEPVELDKWLTIKRYCEHFGINDTQVVTNWIRRGIIPPENVKEVEELNGLRLIKAIPYNT
ncbi:BTB/POZ domain-containing protein [Emticicia fontis]